MLQATYCTRCHSIIPSSQYELPADTIPCVWLVIFVNIHPILTYTRTCTCNIVNRLFYVVINILRTYFGKHGKHLLGRIKHKHFTRQDLLKLLLGTRHFQFCQFWKFNLYKAIKHTDLN